VGMTDVLRDRPLTSYLSPLTSHFSLLLRLRISGRKRHPVGELAVEADLEGVLPGTGKRHVEHQHGPSFHIDHAGGWLPELHSTLASQELAPALIHEADPDGVNADLGAPPPNPEHQMSAGVDRGKVR
jgi:hypothetical protein